MAKYLSQLRRELQTESVAPARVHDIVHAHLRGSKRNGTIVSGKIEDPEYHFKRTSVDTFGSDIHQHYLVTHKKSGKQHRIHVQTGHNFTSIHNNTGIKQLKKEDLDEATSGKHAYHAWDNGGKTADRYTVMSHADYAFHKKTGRPVDALGMSDEPTHPSHGVSQFGSATAGKHLGKKVPFHKLPSHIQAHTKARYGQNVNESFEGGDLVEGIKNHHRFRIKAEHADQHPYFPKGAILTPQSQPYSVPGTHHQYMEVAHKSVQNQEVPVHHLERVKHVKEDLDAELDAIYDSDLITEEEHDEHGAHELVLHADNDSHLYHSSHIPIVKNLEKKHKKGIYDSEKAKKLWKYHADRAAQSYHHQHGDKSQHWKHAFSPATRRAAAAHWEEHHRHEMEAGNFHDH